MSGFSRCIESQSAANGLAIGFDGRNLLPFGSVLPNPYQRFLDNILGLCRIQSDAKSQTKEFILKWQDVISEADFFHLSN
jgi:hypothetical protein